VVGDHPTSDGCATPAATIADGGGNVVASLNCGFGDLAGVDTRLGPLADNGGPTRTRALLDRSPAVGVAGSCTGVDQRGVTRPGAYRLAGERACDAGAFERDDAREACTIAGTAGGDVLHGTTHDDVICGRGGGDSVRAIGGADLVYGGPGADTLRGGAGADTLIGGDGNDILRGFGAGDALIGLDGGDVIEDGGGDDQVTAGPGADTLIAGLGADTVDGGAGVDLVTYGARLEPVTVTLDSSAPDPWFFLPAPGPPDDGGSGERDAVRSFEDVVGGARADLLIGTAAANLLRGNAGADDLRGDAGPDRLFGGNGDDHLAAGVDGDADALDCGAGLDATAEVAFGDSVRGNCER
jgi:Ca2+-binding RTX toxin-like protein